ncbi:MAG: hypothetical protein HAW62_01425 [Endozoicomonadaceae bacterium]|nr:hypothetical protein [Endozoicomonadaceae bacterium]
MRQSTQNLSNMMMTYLSKEIWKKLPDSLILQKIQKYLQDAMICLRFSSKH